MTLRDRPEAQARVLAVGILGLVALSYAPSLSGDWVWDDLMQIAGSGALARPLEWLVHDVWWLADGSTPSTLYRPLAVITHVPGQAWVGGPGVERVVNLLLHLIAVVLVARIGAGAGADPRAAWLGAALLGVHPGASEAVAWISARHDLLASVFVLAGWLALVRRRDVLAGVLLGLAPFCKEPFLLAPVAAALWMLAVRRFAPRTLMISSAGGLLYLVIRMAIELPLPVGAARLEEPVAALGGVARRGLELVALPGAADALPLFAPSLVAGVATLLAGAISLAFARGRPVLGAILLPLPMLLPAAAASAESGIIGDRFFYVAFAGLAVASGLALSRLWEWNPRLAAVAGLLIPALASGTWLRAADWTDNHSLFSASLERDPRNPYAAFHVGYTLHTEQGSCEQAIPYYLASQGVEPRAGNNLQACFVEMGRFEEAIALGGSLVQRDRRRGTPAANTARALLALGRVAEAESWAREALARQPDRPRTWVLLGTSLGRQGLHREALEAFRRALALDPENGSARRGLAVARSEIGADVVRVDPRVDGGG
ncbi:MAG: tetratricopeptide repeat protein [Deltaproteobacteria bacterium]|nr:tetratricopeptide repeat protein [Deltaproteobacteria bacterium]